MLMKKVTCAKCGAKKKMAKGGSTKLAAAGIPYAAGAGQTDGKIATMKSGGAKKSFPDLNKDGKITRADILKGRGVIKKKGGIVKKQNGGPTVQDKELFPGSQIAAFLGLGAGIGLAARRQNNPKVQQKQKERIIAREQKRAMRKKN